MTLIINQAILIFYNILNAYYDANRIKKNLTIHHALNFWVYLILTATIILLFKLSFLEIAIFCFSSFFNRQIYFDVTLNLKRGLSWGYMPKNNPNESVLDKAEVRLFGYDGKMPTVLYSLCWIITILVNLLIN